MQQVQEISNIPGRSGLKTIWTILQSIEKHDSKDDSSIASKANEILRS